MKKIVTVGLVFFSITMGAIFVIGFFQKQNKENSSPSVSTGTSNNANSGGSVKNSGSNSSSTASKIYTLADISTHNTINDCWLVINGNVYNVTTYLAEHPGGIDIVAGYCGEKDATKAFETQGGGGRHSSRASNMLQSYQIGTLK